MMRCPLLATLILLSAAAAAADETYYATLVPQPGTGSAATGTATLTLNADQTALSYAITVTGLTSPEVGAHIHRADGSIAHELPTGSPKNGVWHNIGFLDVAALQLGQLFILVHTENNPGGEVRGDITDEEVPARARTWGKVKALY